MLIIFQKLVVCPQLITKIFLDAHESVRAWEYLSAGFSDALAPKFLKYNTAFLFSFIHYGAAARRRLMCSRCSMCLACS